MEPNPKRSSVSAVRVLVAENGGNPRTSDDIRRTADGFLILPFSEDGDPNYKFRLDVDLVNDSPAPVETLFVIEWADEEYAKFRRYVLLSQGDDWQKLPAELDETRTRVLIPVPPGSSHLSMHPAYNYGRLCRFLDGLDRSILGVVSVGKSRRGRDIWAVEAGRAVRRPLLTMVRVHPYESIGSFMMEGMLQWLGGGVRRAGRRRAHRVLPLHPSDEHVRHPRLHAPERRVRDERHPPRRSDPRGVQAPGPAGSQRERRRPQERFFLSLGTTAPDWREAAALLDALKDVPAFHAAQGYVLRITPAAALVAVSEPVGLSYGVLTVMQIARSAADGTLLPAVSIVDWPVGRVRAAHIRTM